MLLSKHVTSVRHVPRTLLLAVVVLTGAALAAPSTLLTAAQSATPIAAKARAPWTGNLLTGNASTFDNGSGGWTTPSQATRVGDTAVPAQNGPGSLAVTNFSAQPATALAVSGSSASNWTKATPGSRYMGWTSARAASTGRNARSVLLFFDSHGGPLDRATGQALTDSSSSWQSLYPAVGIAPPNTAYVALQVAIDTTAPSETHYIDNAWLKSAPGGVSHVVGPLHTVGNQIVDANNHAIVFRGVNRTGLEGAGGAEVTNGDLLTNDDIAHAQAWGANFVRVPLGEQFWMPTTCYYDANYVSKVDSAVNIITSRGMVAMLNLHYNTITTCGHYGEQPMADAPNALTFWQQVAARYKNNPLVAFDLYNEPFNLTDEIWAHGGAVTWHDTTFQAAGMQQMLDAVRGTGAQNLVFVGGNTWANWFPKTAPLAGSNIVYAIHAYTCSQSLPPACNNGAPYDPSQFLKNWITPSKTYPVMVTEFGWPDGGADGRYVHNVISYAEAHGWGWSVFDWGTGNWGPFALAADPGPGKDYEPAPGGMAVLAAFAGN